MSAPSLGSARAALLLFALVLGASACAEVPADRYGVGRLHLEGVEDLDEYALRACLATAQRERFDVNLGRATEPPCNEPPFDSTVRLRLPLWKWPWTDWPLYDRNVFERDLQRVERWYRARGYYQARVSASSHDPPAAANSDRVDDETECEPVDDDEGCTVELSIQIEEGEPVVVESITMDGLGHLEGAMSVSDMSALDRELQASWELEEGSPFDEALYERSKNVMLRELHEAGLGCATVTGDVAIDPERHLSQVRYTVEPGPRTYIGDVELSGYEDLSPSTIRAVADVDSGDLYTETLLESARHAIYALGTFASVEMTATPRRAEDGICLVDDAGNGVVDVSIRVTPGRRLRYGVGVGLQTGQLGTDGTAPIWDIHLLGYIEHRNFLGGLRRARFEARPKLIFLNTFPSATGPGGERPRPGLELRLEIRQPAFVERRTTGVFSNRYELGPDPFIFFFRHDLDSSVGIRRNFFDGRLSVAIGLHFNLYRVSDEAAQSPPSDYELLFLEQIIQLDLRDDTRNPTKGVYFGVEAQEAALLTWDYLRFVPDARAYVPLGPLVLAGRFRLGWLRIFNGRGELDPVSSQLGPQRYRLRAGGASSHRGFLPGFLGDPLEYAGRLTRDVDGNLEVDNYFFRSNSGGLRRWEASLELRAPVSEDFGIVFFGDMGDVNREAKFRFTHIHLALGFGLRYQTIIGPFRVDFGFLIPGAQVVGQSGLDNTNEVSLGFVRWAGALHLTIGEAF